MVCLRLKKLLPLSIKLATVIIFVIFVHFSFRVFAPSGDRISIQQRWSAPPRYQTMGTQPGKLIQQKVPHPHHPYHLHPLFFLKVHKAASTTVQNILYRLAIQHRLLVLLPQPQHINILHEWSKDWLPNAVPLPRGASHFDLICNHLIFHEESVRKVLPEDAYLVGIVRRPFQQFLSAFWFYREVYKVPYLKKIPGKRPVSRYLRNPRRFEAQAGVRTFTHNRMSLDFGMELRNISDEVYVQGFIQYLNSTFQLVMVSERFDESVVLLRRLLGWKIQDVLYLQNNAFRDSHRFEQNFTRRERKTHHDFNFADYQLYHHFAQVFDAKIRAAGDDFQAEVKAFRMLLKSVKGYCGTPGGPERAVTIRAVFWAEEILLTSETCRLMELEEIEFVELMRRSNAAIIRSLGSSGGQ